MTRKEANGGNKRTGTQQKKGDERKKNSPTNVRCFRIINWWAIVSSNTHTQSNEKEERRLFAFIIHTIFGIFVVFLYVCVCVSSKQILNRREHRKSQPKPGENGRICASKN